MSPSHSKRSRKTFLKCDKSTKWFAFACDSFMNELLGCLRAGIFDAIADLSVAVFAHIRTTNQTKRNETKRNSLFSSSFDRRRASNSFNCWHFLFRLWRVCVCVCLSDGRGSQTVSGFGRRVIIFDRFLDGFLVIFSVFWTRLDGFKLDRGEPHFSSLSNLMNLSDHSLVEWSSLSKPKNPIRRQSGDAWSFFPLFEFLKRDESVLNWMLLHSTSLPNQQPFSSPPIKSLITIRSKIVFPRPQ